MPAEAAGRTVRFIPEAGARWRRRCLEAMLRFGIRRRLGPEAGIDHLREVAERMDLRFGATERDVRRTPVDAGGVAAEWIDVASGGDGPVIIYLHGGAFCLRFPCTHAALVARLCRRLGARGLLPDYRLAPEHRFPAAFEDSLGAYLAVLERAQNDEKVFVAGDSAGGGLALALGVAAVQRGLPLPAAIGLLCPAIDWTLEAMHRVPRDGREPMLTPDLLRRFCDAYLDADDRAHPALSPLLADLAGLPPLVVDAAGNDTLLEQSQQLVDKARNAGVTVQYRERAKMPHGFHSGAGLLGQADRALDEVAAALVALSSTAGTAR